jgi:hypothetical protein
VCPEDDPRIERCQRNARLGRNSRTYDFCVDERFGPASLASSGHLDRFSEISLHNTRISRKICLLGSPGKQLANHLDLHMTKICDRGARRICVVLSQV